MRNGARKVSPVIALVLLLFIEQAIGSIIYTNVNGFSGAASFGAPVLGTNGFLYGTATSPSATNPIPSRGSIFVAATNSSPFLEPYGIPAHNFALSEGGAPLAGLTLGDDGYLYGTTAYYASSNSLFPAGMGSIYVLKGTNFFLVHQFGSSLTASNQPLDGASPRAVLARGPNDYFFGSTYLGGANGYTNGSLGCGTLFGISTNGALTTLHSFQGIDGQKPTVVIYAQGGNLYGVTKHGGLITNLVNCDGDLGFGTVFTCTTNGTLSTLYSFGSLTNDSGNALDGAAPNSLTQARNGVLYGTTSFGGSNIKTMDSEGNIGCGTIFQITTNGTFTSLYSFGAVTNSSGVALDGAGPVGALAQGLDDSFFGVTQFGGSNNIGTVFRVTTNGALTTLYSFTQLLVNPDFLFPTNFGPRGGLLLAPDGQLYGTIYSIGAASGIKSEIFRIGPSAPAILSSPGFLTVVAGATNSLAMTVSSIYPTSCQWRFNGTNLTDGDFFSGSTTTNLIFSSVSPFNAGTYTLVASNVAGTASASASFLVVPAQLSFPTFSPIIAAGSTNTLSMTVTAVLPSTYQWQCNGINLSDGGNLSGTSTTNLTITGAALTNTGVYSLVVSNYAGFVRSLSKTLTVQPFLTVTSPTNLTLLAGATASFTAAVTSIYPSGYQWQFNGVNVAGNSHIFVSTNNTLIITNALPTDSGAYTLVVTNAGGMGTLTAFLTVISPTVPGCTISNLHSFTAINDGGHPNGLIVGLDGALYGTTSFGGSNSVPQGGSGDGTFFRFATNGTLTTLYSFAGGSDGADPSGPLVQGSNGVFYGATASDINSQDGTVFSATTNGIITTLETFYWTNGADPEQVTVGTDGNIYGAVGPYTGSIYRINPTMTNFTTLLPLGGALGSDPGPALVRGRDGKLYGSTTASGGTIFQFDPLTNFITLFAFTNSNLGSSPQGALLEIGNGIFYGTTSSGGAHGDGTIFRFSTNEGLTLLYSFGSVTNWDGSALDGDDAISGLTLGPDSNLYGTTAYGGYSNCGTVFRVTTNGNFTTVVWLNSTVGSNPSFGPLAIGSDGNLYGSTEYGGANNFGTIFQVILPPTPPRIMQASTFGGVISLAWGVTTGKTYQVQFSLDFGASNWVNLGNPFVADSPQLNFSDTITNSAGFYRVIQISGQ